jgi:hypothetical protein
MIRDYRDNFSSAAAEDRWSRSSANILKMSMPDSHSLDRHACCCFVTVASETLQPGTRALVESHANPEELRRIPRDVLDEARKLDPMLRPVALTARNNAKMSNLSDVGRL